MTNPEDRRTVSALVDLRGGQGLRANSGNGDMLGRVCEYNQRGQYSQQLPCPAGNVTRRNKDWQAATKERTS